MPSMDAARLRKWADDLDAEERGEREQQLEAKIDRLEAQLSSSGLSEEDRQLLTQAQARLDALEQAGASDEQEAQADPVEPDDQADEKKTSVNRVRPGRKSGAAYDWTVDEDGNVSRSDVAVVYTGADEADEVEIPA